MTIGDVLAVVAGVIGAALSIWSLVVGAALLFERRARRAAYLLETRPLACLARGAMSAATAGLFAILLLSQANGLVKLIGMSLFLGLAGTAALGAGGLALLVADRIRGLDPRLSPFAALGRGAALMVLAGLVPLLGWFLVTGTAFLVSLGAGLAVLRLRREVVSIAANGVELEPAS
jgi:hypothetical protein